MKKFNIINNIVDTEVFQKEFMADIPQATFSEKNGENFIYVDDKFENEVESYLKKKCVRFIPMTEKQIEYEGYNVTVSEDSSFYYIDFNSGAGEAVYEKADWTLDDALKDQLNLDKESWNLSPSASWLSDKNMNDKKVYIVLCNKIIANVFDSPEKAFNSLPKKDEFAEVSQSVRTCDGEEAIIPTADNFYLNTPIYVHVAEHTEDVMGFQVECQEETFVYEIKEFEVK